MFAETSSEYWHNLKPHSQKWEVNFRHIKQPDLTVFTQETYSWLFNWFFGTRQSLRTWNFLNKKIKREKIQN